MLAPPKDAGRRQVEVLQIAEGYFGSQVLFATHALGVYDRLAQGPLETAELARKLETAPDPLERLLNAAAGMGLVTLKDGVCANSEMSDTVLVTGRPGYIGNWLRLMWHWSRCWVRLAEAVQTGKAVEDPQRYLGGDPVYTRDFIMGMHDYAQLRGSEIVRFLDFSGGLKLLDVGGGPGTYSILFAKEWPDLRPAVFDLPKVLEIAAENCRTAGVVDRVALLPGNYHEHDLGEGYDVVFLSDVLHQESPEGCVELLRKAHRALKPGGRIVVQAMFLNEDRTTPRWAVMHSLILLVIGAAGRAYTAGETIRMMEAAGFSSCNHRRMSLLNVNSLILAEKPAPS